MRKTRLEAIFTELLTQYTSNHDLIAECWQEIEENYSGKGRHYHTLTHLEHLMVELDACKELISNWNLVLFSLFYHDIIYKSTRSDNEEQSAKIAQERMLNIGCDTTMAAKAYDYIFATKSHTLHPDLDCNIFTDADLAILGKPWEQYAVYTKQVRDEYRIYPYFLYKGGRKKVLKHFLNMDHIFKTDFFRNQYESQARQNLEKELKNS